MNRTTGTLEEDAIKDIQIKINNHNKNAAKIDGLFVKTNESFVGTNNDKYFHNYLKNEVLHCDYKSETWKDWHSNLASTSRHHKNTAYMFDEPQTTKAMMIGNACEQTALLSVCKQLKLKIVKNFYQKTFIHQDYNVFCSPDAIVYSADKNKMYVVEIKTSSKLELSTIIGEPDRIKKGKGQLYYTLNLLKFCKTGILVDFVFVKELQQPATRIRYYNIDEKVKDGNEELNPETWFQTMDRAFGTNKFDGNEDIMAWREKRRKKQKKNKKKNKKERKRGEV